MLELTRIRSGALRPELVTVSAADLVRLAVDRLGPTLDGRTINLDFDPELPDVRVDALLMEHVLVNLLENIGRPRPVRRRDRRARRRARVRGSSSRVVDHGPGIPVADRERIFDEFVAPRRSRPTAREPGSGWRSCARSCDANGGAVRCEETPGGGATFVLDLPIADDEEEAP